METDGIYGDKDRITNPNPAIDGSTAALDGQDGETRVGPEMSPTKLKILDCAATLFATKGFTETSVRELATAAGLQGSSIYNHFASKTAILEYMLDEYVYHNYNIFFDDKMRRILNENPSVDGILACFKLTFDDGKSEYHYKLLSTIMQEQHRVPFVGEYVRGSIAQTEQFVKLIIDTLIEQKALKPDMDPDYWMKMASCIFYTFSNRAVMGCGDISSEYKGLGMVGLLERLFKRMFIECSADGS